MERHVLSTILHSRSKYEVLKEYINTKDYSKEFNIIYKYIEEYYNTDISTQAVDTEVLLFNIKNTISSDKQYNHLHDIITTASSDTSVSSDNIQRIILQVKRHELGIRLATTLVSGDQTKVRAALEEYDKVDKATTLEETQPDIEIINGDFASVEQEFSTEGLIKVLPTALNDRLDGGVHGGTHILVFGRPESGKSLFSINMACGFLKQGLPGIYFINEDRTRNVASRFMQNLTQSDKHQVRRDFHAIRSQAIDAGMDKLTVVGLSPGTLKQIEDAIKKYQPKWIVLDQIRNILVRAESRVNQLEAAATGMRNLIKRYDLVGISVTQAGDSATNKEYLEMGDVDFSNTGIPAQADLMIGVGVTTTFEVDNLRGISLPKNKISGLHDKFCVQVMPITSKVISL